MPRKRRRFRPPKANDPPTLVVAEWIDAQYDHGDCPSDEGTGPKRVPAAGFHVSTVSSGPDGPYVVVAIEHDHDEKGTATSRFRLSIPTGWIKSWTEYPPNDKPRRIWPEQPEDVNDEGKGRETDS